MVGGLRQMMTKRDLKGARRKTVREVAGYFERNRGRMKYDEDLAAGYPIGSGVAEGACRHLVKDRLERTGMRWHPDGAQAMLAAARIADACGCSVAPSPMMMTDALASARSFRRFFDASSAVRAEIAPARLCDSGR